MSECILTRHGRIWQAGNLVGACVARWQYSEGILTGRGRIWALGHLSAILAEGATVRAS